MVRSTATFYALLAVLSAAPGTVFAQQNSLVGTWQGTYTFPASAPRQLANLTVDDKLVLTPDGRFTETEQAKNGKGDVVSGHYTLLPGNVLHLTPEASRPRVEQLGAEDYHYRFTGPNQLTVNYQQSDPNGAPIPIQETLRRVP